MNDLYRLHKNAMRLWFDMAAAQQHAAMTIAMRLPMIAAEAGKPLTPKSETVRMVAEKTAAATQGASKAASTAVRASMRRRKSGPVAMAQAGVAIIDAFTKPGGRTVRANSRRLARHKSR